MPGTGGIRHAEKKLEEVLETFFYRMPDDRLSKEAAKILYEEGIDRGVTRLERYASCAFAHFLAYGLRLRERQEYEFKPLGLGNLFHRGYGRILPERQKYCLFP